MAHDLRSELARSFTDLIQYVQELFDGGCR
jgi:hypothetical protein